MGAFEQALPIILREEGGFSNDPADPGGITNLGVTKRVWEAWTHNPASESDMRSLTVSQVAPLYRAQYWNALDADSLPPAIALCVFDFGVNAGVARAARLLQSMVGVLQDGHVGPNTGAALNNWVSVHSIAEVVRQYQVARVAFYKSLPTFSHFGAGWINRCTAIETAALKIC